MTRREETRGRHRAHDAALARPKASLAKKKAELVLRRAEIAQAYERRLERFGEVAAAHAARRAAQLGPAALAAWEAKEEAKFLKRDAVLQRLAEARMYDKLLDRLDGADRRSGEKHGLRALWVGVVLGLSVAGVLALYFLFRRVLRAVEGVETRGLAAPAAAPQVIMLDNRSEGTARLRVGTSVDPGSDPAAILSTRAVRYPSHMRSITLPPISGLAVRIASAPDVAYRVGVRTVGPPGSFAVLSYDATELNTPGIAAIPNGDTMLLPAGSNEEFRLMPRQALYAKGNISGVVVSVSASELLEA